MNIYFLSLVIVVFAAPVQAASAEVASILFTTTCPAIDPKLLAKVDSGKVAYMRYPTGEGEVGHDISGENNATLHPYNEHSSAASSTRMRCSYKIPLSLMERGGAALRGMGKKSTSQATKMSLL